jgi:hypothetical protein
MRRVASALPRSLCLSDSCSCWLALASTVAYARGRSGAGWERGAGMCGASVGQGRGILDSVGQARLPLQLAPLDPVPCPMLHPAAHPPTWLLSTLPL